MGNNASSDDRHQVLVVQVLSSQSLEVKCQVRVRLRLVEAGQRMVSWLWRRIVGCWRWLRNRWRSLCDRGRPIWRFLYTRWIVADITFGGNPVLVGLIAFVLPVVFYVVLVSAAIQNVEPKDLFLFLWKNVIAMGESWREDVCRNLLSGDIDRYSGRCAPAQSPIGDYLAMEVIILFIANVGHSLLSLIPNPLTRGGWHRLVAFMRGVGVALVIVANFVLTLLVSYGFLWPLPSATSIYVFYVGLVAFMLTVGVVHPLAKVHASFPARPELIRNAISQHQKGATSMAKNAQWRRVALGREVRRGEIEISSMGTHDYGRESIHVRIRNRLRLFWVRLIVKSLRFRATDPRRSAGHQVVLSLLLRLCMGLLAGVVVLIVCSVLELNPLIGVVVVWTILLVAIGLLDSMFVCAGVFRFKTWGGKIVSTFAILVDFVVLSSVLLAIQENEIARNYFARIPYFELVAGSSTIFLLIAEAFCILFSFEFRDPTLVGSVRGECLDNCRANLLRGYLCRKWGRSRAPSRHLSNKCNRHSSWPPCRSFRSLRKRVKKGGVAGATVRENLS